MHILGKSQEYFRLEKHLKCISSILETQPFFISAQAYLQHILGVFGTYHRHISSISFVFLRLSKVHCNHLIYLGHILGTWHAYRKHKLWQISGLFPAYLTYISGIYVAHIRLILDIISGFFNTKTKNLIIQDHPT